MIKTGQTDFSPPVVGWQGENAKPYQLFRLEEMRGTAPRDGHDPKVPHRIGFHAMMLVTEGSFDHGWDFQTHCFSKNQLIYIAPNQIHHFVKTRRAHKACILAFRPEILPVELLQFDEKRVPWSIMCYRWPSVTKLKPKETKLLESQFEFLESLDLNVPNNNGVAAKYHICGIIALAFELAKKNHGEPTEWRSNRQFFEFVQLVEESFAVRRDVTWYAKQMDCSKRTLNRICQRMMGKTAKAFLSERVVIEAKRLLAYEADSVNEVAEKLGFGATTNFVRYFRNETGVTPQAFKDLLPLNDEVNRLEDLTKAF